MLIDDCGTHPAQLIRHSISALDHASFYLINIRASGRRQERMDETKRTNE
jgi:hypothetical protein